MYCRDNSYSDGIDRFIVITVATENNKELDRFRESCHINNIPYKIIGLGQEWTGGEAKDGVLLQPGGAQKINLLKKELEDYPNLSNHIILFTDSYDVIINSTPSEIVSKFRTMKSPVVFSAEKTCWPKKDLQNKYPPSTTEYRFLNSGGFIGYGDHIIKIVNKIDVSNDYDDQLYYTERYFESLVEDKNIILDNNQNIFQTLNESLDDVLVKDGKVFNRITNTYPLIIHGNGGSSIKNVLNDYYRRLFDEDITTTNYFKKEDDLEDFSDNVSIGLFLDEEVPNINQTFDHIRFLKYPKDKISLTIYYSDNTHKYDVDLFEKKYSHIFKEFYVKFNDDGKIKSRKDFLINSYGLSDYTVLMESNHIFRNNKSLGLIIKECEGIITPMIHKEGSDWVNFDCEKTKKDSYRTYETKGIWEVNYLYGIHVIKNDLIPYCVNSLYINYDNYTDPNWDIMLCDNLKSRGETLQISNTNYYGGII